MKKKDLIIIAVMLIAAVIFGLAYRYLSEGNDTKDKICIYINDEVYKTVILDGTEQDINIEQKSGETNVIHITPDGAYMQYSSCKNQLCVNQGEVNTLNHTSRGMGDWIICLPNKISIEFIEGKDN